MSTEPMSDNDDSADVPRLAGSIASEDVDITEAEMDALFQIASDPNSTVGRLNWVPRRIPVRTASGGQSIMSKPDVLSELREINCFDDLTLYTPDLCKRAVEEIERLRQERNRLFVWVVDVEQMEKSRPSEEPPYYHPKSEAMELAFQIMAEGCDAPIEERDAMAKHDKEYQA